MITSSDIRAQSKCMEFKASTLLRFLAQFVRWQQLFKIVVSSSNRRRRTEYHHKWHKSQCNWLKRHRILWLNLRYCHEILRHFVLNVRTSFLPVFGANLRSHCFNLQLTTRHKHMRSDPTEWNGPENTFFNSIYLHFDGVWHYSVYCYYVSFQL